MIVGVGVGSPSSRVGVGLGVGVRVGVTLDDLKIVGIGSLILGKNRSKSPSLLKMSIDTTIAAKSNKNNIRMRLVFSMAYSISVWDLQSKCVLCESEGVDR